MDLAIFDFYRNTIEKSIFVNVYVGGNKLGICQIFYTSTVPKIEFVGEEWSSGLGGLVNLVTYC